MRIVVIGGTGLIGSRLVARLEKAGHDAVAASPSSGVDVISGAGLTEALAGADAVVDVVNAPVWEPDALIAFFRDGSANLLRAEREAGVRHHVALSIVGIDRGEGNPYFRGKLAQEEAIRAGGVPFTILRATQFFEFVATIAETATEDGVARLSTAAMRPVAADDVVSALAEVVTGPPADGIVELAGPDTLPMDELARRVLAASGDDREVVGDPDAGYFGAAVDDRTLVPEGEPEHVGAVGLEAWLRAAAAA
jgi:uncharacterized protein YbjT (DUF2867 family)